MKSLDDRTLFVEGPKVIETNEMFARKDSWERLLTRRLEMSLGDWSDATVPKMEGYMGNREREKIIKITSIIDRRKLYDVGFTSYSSLVVLVASFMWVIKGKNSLLKKFIVCSHASDILSIRVISPIRNCHEVSFFISLQHWMCSLAQIDILHRVETLLVVSLPQIHFHQAFFTQTARRSWVMALTWEEKSY